MKKKSVSADASLPLIGQKAPAFEASSSSGALSFPEGYVGNWVVLFSHTRSFNASPSNLSAIREIGEEFLKNGCKLVDLYSGDFGRYVDRYHTLENQAISSGMERFDPQFVLVDDESRSIAESYGICAPGETFLEDVSSFFVIDPSAVIRTILMYHPDNVHRAFDDLLRIVIALRKNDELRKHEGFRANDCPNTPMQVRNRVALAF